MEDVASDGRAVFSIDILMGRFGRLEYWVSWELVVEHWKRDLEDSR